MSTLYLQIDDTHTDNYPVRLGWVDADLVGTVDLESIGALPVALPPKPAGLSEGAYLHGLIANAAGARLAADLSADPASVVVDVRPPSLAALPWESMAAGPRYPFINSSRPWSRGRWRQTGQSSRTLGPLRLMVVVCDPDPALRAEEEIDGIHRGISRSLGRIYLEVIDSPPTWAALRQKLNHLVPHVVHFIGHTSKTETQSVLQFSPPAPEHPDWELTSSLIENSWPQGARLVVVSACRSARGPASGVETLTDALKAAGVPAVIGMRGDIDSEAAVDFAAEFYGHLADGENVDAAASAGRRAIFDRAPSGPDWHHPVLETRVPAAHVLPIRFAVDYRQLQGVHAIPEFLRLRKFVDRSEQRRLTWWAIDPEEIPGQHGMPGGVLIAGPRKSGKTSLAQAVLLICYLRGRRLHYIDLAAGSGEGELHTSAKDWLGALRAIRDGTPGCRLSPALDPQAFATFNARLNWLLKNPPTASMPTQAAGLVQDEWQGFDPDAGQALQRIRIIFDDFVSALEKVSARQPLILALDSIDGVQEKPWQDYVMPNLIVRLANGVRGVSLMLIVPHDLIDSRIPHGVKAAMERVGVQGFEHTQIDRVLREFGVYTQLSKQEISRIRTFMGDINGPIPPEVLGKIADILPLLPQAGG